MLRQIFIIFFISLFIVSVGFSQSQEVSFIHGLNDNTTVWNTMANQLSNEFDFIRDDVGYNSSLSISSSASSVNIPYGTVGVSHSMGGLLAREYLRQRGTSRMKALITVGTPHSGAMAASAVQNGSVGGLASAWIEDMLAGPAVSLGGYVLGREWARKYVLIPLRLIANAVGESLENDLEAYYGNLASVDDMKSGSSFLNTLNTAPNNTLPAARYTIFGSEDFYDYVRIADSFRQKSNGSNPIETGTLIKYHRGITSFYFLVGSYYSYAAWYWHSKYLQTDSSDPQHFEYYDRYVFADYASREWFRGHLSLVYYQQRDWDYFITGANYYYIDGNIYREASDGLLPFFTQAPSFFEKDGTLRRLRADGSNHLEETVHPSVKQRFSEVFQRQDVNIPTKTSSGGGDSGDVGEYPPPDDDCSDPTQPCQNPDIK